MASNIVAEFEDAWHATSGSDIASRFARQSLRASAQESPELLARLTELEAPTQEALQLRLTGSGVTGHSTSAAQLGTLFTSLSAAVREIARSHAPKGKKKSWHSALVATAPAPGSVILDFAVPEPNAHTDPVTGTDPGTLDAQALRTVVNVMAQASEDDDALDASTEQLPKAARRALETMASTIYTARWDVEGNLTARGRTPICTLLTADGALRLKQSASKINAKNDDVIEVGLIDGFRWSTGTIAFAPNTARAFSASVPQEIQFEVSRLHQSKTPVQAKFVRTRFMPAGSDTPKSTSYALVSLEPFDTGA